MTREEILAIGAGKQLDALIIQKMEFDLKETDEMGHWVYIGNDQDASLFKPSENVRDAWHIVDRMQSDYSFEIRAEGTYLNPKRWAEAKFGGFTEEYVRAETAPLAICRAALVVVFENAD